MGGEGGFVVWRSTVVTRVGPVDTRALRGEAASPQASRKGCPWAHGSSVGPWLLRDPARAAEARLARSCTSQEREHVAGEAHCAKRCPHLCTVLWIVTRLCFHRSGPSWGFRGPSQDRPCCPHLCTQVWTNYAGVVYGSTTPRGKAFHPGIVGDTDRKHAGTRLVPTAADARFVHPREGRSP